jgi:predicted secreted protein
LSLSCATSLAQKSSSPNWALTKQDSGKTITVPQGGIISIKFRENPSTGYTWNCNHPNQIGTTSLNLVSSTYVQDPAPPGFTGVPGNRICLFQAQKTGTVHLTLKYLRSGSGDPNDQFDIIVNVQPISLPKVTITKDDSGKTIDVHVGDKIAVQLPVVLPSLPACTWEIEKTDTRILQLQSSTTNSTRTFLFIAQKMGTVHLKIACQRSGGQKVVYQFNTTINVKQNVSGNKAYS